MFVLPSFSNTLEHPRIDTLVVWLAI